MGAISDTCDQLQAYIEEMLKQPEIDPRELLKVMSDFLCILRCATNSGEIRERDPHAPA